MSERSAAESAHARAEEKTDVIDAPPKTSVPQPGWRQSAHWPTYAALALAVVAVVLAGLAYFYPAHGAAPAIAQQGGDAKANVCTAYVTVREGVVLSTHQQSPNPGDPVGQLSVATNARVSLIGGGAYLQQRLAANTAAPADLKRAASSMADTIQQLGVNYLAGAGNNVQGSLRRDLDSKIGQLNDMCK
jgi:hypothetical protein